MVVQFEPELASSGRPGWNDTERPYPRHLLMHQLVEQQARARPDAVAVLHDRHQITYATLDSWAEDWAARLRQAGVAAQDLVGVQLERDAELVAAMLGVLKAGAAYVPLDPTYPRDRLDYIAADAGLSALIAPHSDADSDLPVLIPGPGPSHRASGPAPSQRPSKPGPVAPESLAYVLYTSGSTGRPKGVALTHANAVDLLCWTGETFGSDLDRVLASTSTCFDCSILEIFGPLSWGGTVVLVDSPADVTGPVGRTDVVLVHLVPSIADDLLRTGRLPAAVRTAIVGGEAFGLSLARTFGRRSGVQRLVNLYGPAECTSYATMALVDPRSPVPPSIGRPVANTRIYLLDPQGDPVEPGEHGEIFVAGAGLARGYLHRPALTAERFVPEPGDHRPGSRMYRTGDLAYLDDGDDLRFLGRLDDQIKVHGVRIEPEEITQALISFPGVREAVAAASTSPGGRSLLNAYVVPAGDTEFDDAALRRYLRERLPATMVPDQFVILPELPRLPNNKIDRRRLAQLRPPAPDPVADPMTEDSSRTPWETALAELWSEVVDSTDIDLHTDLFSLGGHSLAVLRVRARLAELTGIEFPIRLFYEHSRISALAAVLERRLGGAPSIAPRRGHSQEEPSRPRALSPIQAGILERADAQAGAPGLHLPVAVRLSGRLRPAALAEALRDLVRRHEILRSTVITEPEGDHLMTLSPASPEADILPLVDLSALAPAYRAEKARQVAGEFVGRVIEVRGGPPIRFALLRLDEDDHVLVYVLHHLAGDAWSVETLSHQVLAGYSAAIHGLPPSLPRPRQYGEWALEQDRRLSSDAGQAQYRRRLVHLADPPLLDLPGAPSGTRSPVGGIHEEFSAVPAPDVSALTALGSSETATVYMVLTTLFAALLQRWSGQDDVVIGMPHAGRIQAGLDTVIGPCQDAIPLRCRISGDPSFRGLLRQVRDQSLDAYADGDVRFADLTRQLPAVSGHHPVYQASIVLQHPPSLLDPQYREQVFAREDIGDLRLGPFLDRPQGQTALDLEMMLFERDGAIEAVLAARSDVVSRSDVSLLVEEFVSMARAAATDPDRAVSRLLTERAVSCEG